MPVVGNSSGSDPKRQHNRDKCHVSKAEGSKRLFDRCQSQLGGSLWGAVPGGGLAEEEEIVKTHETRVGHDGGGPTGVARRERERRVVCPDTHL